MKNKPLTVPEFYQKFANTPLAKRLPLLSLDPQNPLCNINLLLVHEVLEMHQADIASKQKRIDEILKAVSEFI